jgi:hypothetical protein
MRYVVQTLWPLHIHIALFHFQLAVKVEDTHLPLSTKKRTTRQSKYTNGDLPGGAHDNNDWRKRFITTYEKWLGMRAEPWIISERENVAALQAIWNVVYPHIDYVVDTECAVYHIVSIRFLLFSMFFFTAYMVLTQTGQSACFRVAEWLWVISRGYVQGHVCGREIFAQG